MTRAETLVRQLADAAMAPIKIEEQRLARRPAPTRPVTPAARAAWAAYRRLSKARAAVERRLKVLGVHTYSSNGTIRMMDDEQAQAERRDQIQRQLARIRDLRQAAMLAVLGLEAAKARPIVLKLKADLEKVAGGARG